MTGAGIGAPSLRARGVSPEAPRSAAAAPERRPQPQHGAVSAEPPAGPARRDRLALAKHPATPSPAPLLPAAPGPAPRERGSRRLRRGSGRGLRRLSNRLSEGKGCIGAPIERGERGPAHITANQSAPSGEQAGRGCPTQRSQAAWRAGPGRCSRCSWATSRVSWERTGGTSR